MPLSHVPLSIVKKCILLGILHWSALPTMFVYRFISEVVSQSWDFVDDFVCNNVGPQKWQFSHNMPTV